MNIASDDPLYLVNLRKGNCSFLVFNYLYIPVWKILICQTIDFDKGVLSEVLIMKMEQRRERILIDSKDRVLRQTDGRVYQQ